MTVTWKEILVFLILFAANLIQAITGFAGTLLAMPPTMQLIGVDEAKSVLTILDQLSCLLIVLTGFRHINWKEFLKMAVLMVAGMFAGMRIFEVFPVQQLLTLYGIMILCIAIWKLFGKQIVKGQRAVTEQIQTKASEEKKGSLWKAGMLIVILAAGVIHGMFVSGGALLVIYAASVMKEKEEFRATMAMLWVTIGCYITANQIQAGHFNSHVVFLCLVGVIPLFAGIIIGTKLVKRIRQETFLKLTYVLLIVSGVFAIV